jgi:aspartyl-tRNA(Asn)/glutamyl-tRNA(Gln) amidotransferase subunit B
MRTPEQAAAYLRALRDVLVYLEICDGNMEEGSFRCDANISLRPRGQKEFGIRTEIKNMNSFRNVAKALDYEIRRQRAILENGQEVVQETRLWDAGGGKTMSMRGKEEAHDYRYFPDPDLLPLMVEEAWVESLRQNLPELPEAKRLRFVEQYGLPGYDAEVLTASRYLADYFEQVVEHKAPAKAASNLIMGDLLGQLHAAGLDIRQSPVSPEAMAELLNLVDSGELSGKMGKEVFSEMFENNESASSVVERKGLRQVSDMGELTGILEEILAANPEQVEQFKAGKEKLKGFFVGQAMKATKGQANPKLVNQLLDKILKG